MDLIQYIKARKTSLESQQKDPEVLGQYRISAKLDMIEELIAFSELPEAKAEMELIKAEQQFQGYISALDEGDVVKLVRAMGLTSNEWERLKRDWGIDRRLSVSDVEYIEEYFLNEG